MPPPMARLSRCPRSAGVAPHVLDDESLQGVLFAKPVLPDKFHVREHSKGVMNEREAGRRGTNRSHRPAPGVATALLAAQETTSQVDGRSAAAARPREAVTSRVNGSSRSFPVEPLLPNVVKR